MHQDMTAVAEGRVAAGPVRNPAAAADELEATFFRTMRPTSLIQRLIEPEEIASLVAYVASPMAAATNGAALRAEGGIVPTI